VRLWEGGRGGGVGINTFGKDHTIFSMDHYAIYMYDTYTCILAHAYIYRYAYIHKFIHKY